MAKYSFEFKKKVVEAYLQGEGGENYLASKFNVASPRQIKIWMKSYQAFGNEGLFRSRKQQKYSFEYKLHVVELYLSSEVSYQELALQESINNPTMLVKWVNDFRIAGPEALRPKKKGRKKSLNSKDIKIRTEQNETGSASTQSGTGLKELSINVFQNCKKLHTLWCAIFYFPKKCCVGTKAPFRP